MDDANKAALLSLLRGALISLGTILGAHGLIGPNNTVTPENWQFIVGFIVAMAPAVWGYVDKIRAAKSRKEGEAIAVQAGINLVHEGASILIEDGAGNQVPKPVTTETAAAIIKTFGPTPEEVQTADLNKKSLDAAKGIVTP